MFSRLHVLELPKVLTEFPWRCSAAFGWCTTAARNKALPKQQKKKSRNDTLPVSGSSQSSLCVLDYYFFYSRWFWIRVDFLNPCKYGHIKACKSAHTPTHARTHNRSPPTCLPLRGKCHCGVQLMRWIQCTLLTVISCLLREETVMTGMKVQVCEHGRKQERGGLPSLTVSRGELENRRVEEEHVKQHREGGKRCGAVFKTGVINFQQQRGLVLSWRDLDALSYPDNRCSVKLQCTVLGPLFRQVLIFVLEFILF